MNTTPHRVQLSRSKGWKMPPDTVKVDRTTKWGNPYRITESVAGTPLVVFYSSEEGDPARNMKEARALAVEGFRAWLQYEGWSDGDIRAELSGKNLACWCPLDGPCHADVLLAIANGGATREKEA